MLGWSGTGFPEGNEDVQWHLARRAHLDPTVLW